MATCVNPNSQFYKKLKSEGYTPFEINLLSGIMEGDSFINWYRGDVENIKVNDDLTITNTRGQKISVDSLFPKGVKEDIETIKGFKGTFRVFRDDGKFNRRVANVEGLNKTKSAVDVVNSSVSTIQASVAKSNIDGKNIYYVYLKPIENNISLFEQEYYEEIEKIDVSDLITDLEAELDSYPSEEISRKTNSGKASKDLTDRLKRIKIDDDLLSDLGKKLATATDALNKRARIYKRNESRKDYIKVLVNRVENLSEQIQSGEVTDAVLSYLNTSHSTLKKLLSDKDRMLDKISGNINHNEAARLYILLKNYVDTYRPISDIEKIIFTDPSYKSIREEVGPIIADIERIRKRIQDDISVVGDKILVEFFETNDPATLLRGKMDWDTYLKTAPRDISWSQLWLNAMAESSDDAIKIIDVIVKNKIREAAFETQSIEDRINVHRQKLINKFGRQLADPAKLWDWMLEKDENGNNTGFIVDSVSSKFRKDMTEDIRKAEKEGISENKKNRLISHWFNKKKLEYSSQQFKDIMADPELKAIYTDMREIYKEAQNNYPPSYVMGLRVPSVLVSDSRKILRQNTAKDRWEQVKENMATNFLREEREPTVLIDEAGNEQQYLPVYFHNKNQDPKLIDYDLGSTFTRFYYESSRYKNIDSIMNVLNLFNDKLKEREYIKRENSKPLSDPGSIIKNKKITIKGDASNTYERWRYFWNMVILGDQIKDEGTWEPIPGIKLDKAKVIDGLNRYTAINALALNIYSNISNVATAGVMRRVEALTNQFFNNKDLLKADAMIMQNIPGMMRDLANPINTNKLTLWIKNFDVEQEFGKKLGRSKHVTNILGQALFAGQRVGDLMTMSRTSLALAFNKKLKDRSGKEVSLWDAFEVKDNKLSLKEEFRDQFTKEDLVSFINLQNGINKRLDGIYNDVDKTALHYRALGRTVMLFRRFIIPGWNRRWEEKKFNYELMSWTEGAYITGFKFIFKDLKEHQFNLSKAFKDLPAYKRQNVLRAAFDGLYMVGISILATFMTKLADDDDDVWALNLAAYQVNRLYTELTFFWNPNEAIKILKSPAAGVNTFQRVIDLFDILNWLDKVETGKNAGETRLQVTLEKLIPLYNTIDKARNPKEQLTWITQ